MLICEGSCVPVPFLLLYVQPQPTSFPGSGSFRFQHIPKDKGTQIGSDHKEIFHNVGLWSPFPRSWVSRAGRNIERAVLE